LNTSSHIEVQNTHWGTEELRRIAETDDLHISPFAKTATYGTLTWIWSIVDPPDICTFGIRLHPGGPSDCWGEGGIRTYAAVEKRSASLSQSATRFHLGKIWSTNSN
jgi:hypothetical protein